MPSITYKKNYLTQVIFKVNFPLIAELTKDVPPDFKEKVSVNFPILEPVKMSNIKVDATPGEVKTEREEMTIWRFKDKEERVFIELNCDYLAIVIKNYINYSEFEKIISDITTIFFDIYKDLVINRLGLRYINQIKLEEKTLYDWTGYLDSSLIANLGFVEKQDSIRRAMSFLEIAIDEETKLRLQYGVFNSTYPGKLLNKEFVLDYDCSTEVQFDKKNLNEKSKKFNDIITEYFEKSIEDNFRSNLNA